MWQGWHGVTLSGFTAGETIAIFGAGPVVIHNQAWNSSASEYLNLKGLMAAYSALLRGASRVYVVDRVKERLDKAKAIG